MKIGLQGGFARARTITCVGQKACCNPFIMLVMFGQRVPHFTEYPLSNIS